MWVLSCFRWMGISFFPVKRILFLYISNKDVNKYKNFEGWTTTENLITRFQIIKNGPFDLILLPSIFQKLQRSLRNLGRFWVVIYPSNNVNKAKICMEYRCQSIHILPFFNANEDLKWTYIFLGKYTISIGLLFYIQG